MFQNNNNTDNDTLQAENNHLRERIAELEQQLATNATIHTQLTDTQKALTYSQNMLNFIINLIPMAVFWKKTDLTYVWCNEQFACDAGLASPEEIVGKNDYDLAWKTEEADFFRKVDSEVMQEGVPRFHVIEPQLQADGKQAWLQTNKVPVRDEHGQVTGVLGTYEDITERKQMEIDLVASEHRFRTMVNSITAAILIHQQGKFKFCNESATEVLGYTTDEIYELSFADFVHPEDLPTVMARAAARYRGEEAPNRYEIRIIHKNGDIRWVDINNHVVIYDGASSIIVTAIDITHIKQVEAELRHSDTRFRVLLENVSVGTLIAQGQKFHYANANAEQITGYTASELCALDAFWDIVHPDYQHIVRKRGLGRQEGKDVPNQYELKIMRKDGEERWVQLNAEAVVFDETPAVIATLIDITERKYAEEERMLLQERIIDAQRATLRELSSPLIPLADNIVAMPLIGAIDDDRMQHIMETLMVGIAEHQADIAILDITGVPSLDTQVADGLVKTARAVQLLGARIILTGIQPAMAQTLTQIGADMSTIVTRRSLQHGITYALNHH